MQATKMNLTKQASPFSGNRPGTFALEVARPQAVVQNNRTCGSTARRKAKLPMRHGAQLLGTNTALRSVNAFLAAAAAAARESTTSKSNPDSPVDHTIVYKPCRPSGGTAPHPRTSPSRCRRLPGPRRTPAGSPRWGVCRPLSAGSPLPSPGGGRGRRGRGRREAG